MSMDMVERVARAIMESLLSVMGEVKPHHREAEWSANSHYHLQAARAAIEAMREPAPGMVEAGQKSHARFLSSADSTWRAMIDAALAEVETR